MKKGVFIVALILVFFIMSFSLVISSNSAREKAREISCISNLRSTGLAFRMYSQEFKGNFPPYDNAKGIEMLRRCGYLENIRLFMCPCVENRHIPEDGSQVTEEVTDYCYKGGLTEKSPNEPLMWDKPGNHKDFGNVLYLNGAVRGLKGKDWLEKAAKSSKDIEIPKPLKSR